MLELITAKIRPGRRKMSEMAFTVGIMSLVDALFGMSMESVLRQITVSTEIREALLRRTGFYGVALRLVECTEQRELDQEEMQRLLEELQLSADDFFEAEKYAFEWGNSISTNSVGPASGVSMAPPGGYVDDDDDD
jgi:EAL and modified HD-GYP domain-containing signal transduction protein